MNAVKNHLEELSAVPQLLDDPVVLVAFVYDKIAVAPLKVEDNHCDGTCVFLGPTIRENREYSVHL